MTITPTSTDVITVAEYSARIGRALRGVGAGIVEGEVQQPKRTAGGMLVFQLTDDTATLACKVFRNQVAGLKHEPLHGERVQASVDRPDVWARGGKLDLIVSDIQLTGDGDVLRRREALLARLTAEGLCNPRRRKSVPKFPRAVGVIAGKNSDGLRDVVQALSDRFPPVHIVTCTAVVQGASAPRDLIDALARLDAHPLVDVIVLARGGGSVQDLMAFDDERLCRAVFACDTPVIAAVGHTDNVPVCNHVTWASETPSRSPELVVPSAETLRQDVQYAAARLAPVSGRVGALRERVADVQVGVGEALRTRRLEVAHADATLGDAEHGFFAVRDAGLAEAREALAGVPGRLPDVADIMALGGPLDTRAVAFFAERGEFIRRIADFAAPVGAALSRQAGAVRETAANLRAVSTGLASRSEAVVGAAPSGAAVADAIAIRRSNTEERGRSLAAGIRKELADHLHDFGRAFTRLVDIARKESLARFAVEDQRLGTAGKRADLDAQQRLTDAQRDLDHVGAVLSASDPRRRGWVLPTDRTDAVVRSVHELALGHHLTLSFHDGAAGVVVENVPIEEET